MTQAAKHSIPGPTEIDSAAVIEAENLDWLTRGEAELALEGIARRADQRRTKSQNGLEPSSTAQ